MVKTLPTSIPPITHNEDIYNLIEHNNFVVVFICSFIVILLGKTALVGKKKTKSY